LNWAETPTEDSTPENHYRVGLEGADRSTPLAK